MTYCDFYKSFCLVEKPQKDKPLENPSLLGGYPPFLVLHFSYYTLMTFLMMLYMILLSMLMILLCSKCDQHLICGNNLNWLLKLNLTYGSNNMGSVDVWVCSWGEIIFEDAGVDRLFQIGLRGWPSLTLSLLLKLSPRKLEPYFVLWSFFLLRLLCIYINLPYAHVWNTAVMSGLVPLVDTWNC